MQLTLPTTYTPCSWLYRLHTHHAADFTDHIHTMQLTLPTTYTPCSWLYRPHTHHAADFTDHIHTMQLTLPTTYTPCSWLYRPHTHHAADFTEHIHTMQLTIPTTYTPCSWLHRPHTHHASDFTDHILTRSTCSLLPSLVFSTALPHKVNHKIIKHIHQRLSHKGDPKLITSCILGISRSSPNTYTPGASSTCLMSATRAAPRADLANNTNCSSCCPVPLPSFSAITGQEAVINHRYLLPQMWKIQTISLGEFGFSTQGVIDCSNLLPQISKIQTISLGELWFSTWVVIDCCCILPQIPQQRWWSTAVVSWSQHKW